MLHWTPSSSAESGRRSSLSVLIPITAAVVTCLVGVCIYCLVHAGKGLGQGEQCLGQRGHTGLRSQAGRMAAALPRVGQPLWGHRQGMAPRACCPAGSTGSVLGSSHVCTTAAQAGPALGGKQRCPVGPVWLPCRGPQTLQPGSSRHDMSCRTRSAAAPALTPESSLQGRSAPLTVAFSVPFSI